jgi:multidrug efflux pump subunit AcrA (membrane-fusion protein)
VNKNFRVRLDVPTDSPLMIGMTVEANIVVARRDDALLVPAASLEAGHVWTVQDGRARARKVETGIVGANRVEILSGIAEGDIVIVSPPKGLSEGKRVRPRPQSTS